MNEWFRVENGPTVGHPRTFVRFSHMRSLSIFYNGVVKCYEMEEKFKISILDLFLPSFPTPVKQ